MLDVRKEQAFKIIDELIESDVIGDIPLDRYIRKHLPSFRTQCIRVFGSFKEALSAYGYECVTNSEKITFSRLIDYIDCCFEINIDGHIRIDFEMLFRKISELQAMGYDIEIDNVIRDVTDYFILDRIESFVLHHNEHIADVLDFRPRQYPINQVEYLIRSVYKTRNQLYKTYHISLGVLSGVSMVKVKNLMQLGAEFESLVGEIFVEATISHERHVIHGDSIPDFISGNTWLDAKLSKSTAMHSFSETITKYRKHTDHLVIIYAIDDTAATDARAKFVHVSEYYPYISAELQRKIDAFVRKASAIKFGGAA